MGSIFGAPKKGIHIFTHSSPRLSVHTFGVGVLLFGKSFQHNSDFILEKRLNMYPLVYTILHSILNDGVRFSPLHKCRISFFFLLRILTNNQMVLAEPKAWIHICKHKLAIHSVHFTSRHIHTHIHIHKYAHNLPKSIVDEMVYCWLQYNANDGINLINQLKIYLFSFWYHTEASNKFYVSILEEGAEKPYTW